MDGDGEGDDRAQGQGLGLVLTRVERESGGYGKLNRTGEWNHGNKGLGKLWQ
jgi:hypothetical protein